MKALTPYLNFDGTTEEAFTFYAQVFGGRVMGVARFRDFGPSMGELSEADLDKVANIGLMLPNGTMLMGTDLLASLGQELTTGNDFSLHVEADDAAEAQRLFAALAEGGSVSMEPAATEWAEWFAGCTDRFGTEWMISFTGSVVFGG
ncbi:MAG: VOC family protein [Candidatus Nanopelagicales bacterium]